MIHLFPRTQNCILKGPRVKLNSRLDLTHFSQCARRPLLVLCGTKGDLQSMDGRTFSGNNFFLGGLPIYTNICYFYPFFCTQASNNQLYFNCVLSNLLIRIIHKRILTRKPIEQREVQFVYLCSLHTKGQIKSE